MEQILPYLINSLLGAGGGYLGNLLKKNGLGNVGNLIAGAVGGNAMPLLVGSLVNSDGMNSIIQYLIPLVGGSVGSLIGGLFKKA